MSRPFIQPLWLQTIYLINANSEDEATARAIGIAQREEGTFKASDGGPNEENGVIEWKYDSVERVIALEGERLQDGDELYWRFLKNSEAQSLLKPFNETRE